MKLHKNQRGFSGFEALLIILLILLLLLGAWFIWYKNKDKAGDKSAQSNAAQSATEESEEEGVQEYLTITEWGVRFKLGANSTGGYYFIEEGKPNYAYLSTGELKNTDCAANKTTTGVYTRFTQNEEDPITQEPYIQQYPNAPKVGNYYFIFSQPQAFCSDDPAVQAKAEAAQDAFKTDVVSVEATP